LPILPNPFSSSENHLKWGGGERSGWKVGTVSGNLKISFRQHRLPNSESVEKGGRVDDCYSHERKMTTQGTRAEIRVEKRGNFESDFDVECRSLLSPDSTKLGEECENSLSSPLSFPYAE